MYIFIIYLLLNVSTHGRFDGLAMSLPPTILIGDTFSYVTTVYKRPMTYSDPVTN